MPDVEELHDDPAMPRHQRLGVEQMPAAGRLEVLMILGGHTAVEADRSPARVEP